MLKKKIYLAGFDVFRPDAHEYGKWLISLCTNAGFEGLFPLDSIAPKELSGVKLANWIYNANINLIRNADIIIANVNDFRATGEPDSGTAFEIGFATAIGKPVWAYSTNKRPLIERLSTQIVSGKATCARGFTVEDFDLPMNLMIACGAKLIYGGPQECLAEIQKFGAMQPHNEPFLDESI
ncbi:MULTISPECIES: nucleoside 2-deoxyribosyltransferase [unclassified Paraburkholderia]|uniref:nucleoside 2-deoxyribosyltransferase n=1 Tax=unclassified Paraburkholderia TaxID=2615204 RepID=UPI002AB2F9B2|nr:MULTISPECIES: nucleoside 2-deoxyribosyltransferase [unclassified Paraburkholderia]